MCWHNPQRGRTSITSNSVEILFENIISHRTRFVLYNQENTRRNHDCGYTHGYYAICCRVQSELFIYIFCEIFVVFNLIKQLSPQICASITGIILICYMIIIFAWERDHFTEMLQYTCCLFVCTPRGLSSVPNGGFIWESYGSKYNNNNNNNNSL